MFENMLKDQKDQKARVKYLKSLGWKEIDCDGDSCDVRIFVYDIDIGYAVFRQGKGGNVFLYHFHSISDAIECAVDRAREEIKDHEIKQMISGEN